MIGRGERAETAIEPPLFVARDLTKTYRRVRALDGAVNRAKACAR